MPVSSSFLSDRSSQMYSVALMVKLCGTLAQAEKWEKTLLWQSRLETFKRHSSNAIRWWKEIKTSCDFFLAMCFAFSFWLHSDGFGMDIWIQHATEKCAWMYSWIDLCPGGFQHKSWRLHHDEIILAVAQEERDSLGCSRVYFCHWLVYAGFLVVPNDARHPRRYKLHREWDDVNNVLFWSFLPAAFQHDCFIN